MTSLSDLQAENARLKALLAQAHEALGPFVKEEDTWAVSVKNSYRPGVTEPNQRTFHSRAEFNIGNLRTARIVHAAIAREVGGE